MKPARRRPQVMGTRLLLTVVYGLLGGAVAVGAWLLVNGIDGVPFYIRWLGSLTPDRLIVAASFLFGCLGGAWLGRDRPHPVLWMLFGGLLSGTNGYAIITFSPDLAFDWPMIVFPCLGGFFGVFCARTAAARPCEAKQVDVNVSAVIAWSLPRFVLALIAIVLGVLLWPARDALLLPIAFASILILACAAIVQETRIRRLEARLDAIAK